MLWQPVEVGTVGETTIVTVAAGAVVLMPPLVVVTEVGIVPRLQTRMPLTAVVGQLPGLAAPETRVDFGPSVSVNKTPATGSPVL